MNTFKKTWELKDSIVLLRVLIGWHFLYEGIIKLYNPEWTSFGYLASAQGPLKPFFTALTGEKHTRLGRWFKYGCSHYCRLDTHTRIFRKNRSFYRYGLARFVLFGSPFISMAH